MTAEVLATLLLEIISNGHVREGSKKLEYEDLLQLVYISKGAVLYEIFQQEITQNGQSSTINSLLRLYPLDIIKSDNGQKKITLPGDVIVLPDDSGLFAVIPVIDNQSKYCDPMISSSPGSEWTICRDDSGMSYFISYGKDIRLFNLSDSIKKVEVTAILNDEDSDIPENAAFRVAQLVLREVLRTIALPIDKTADENPNIDDALKTRLTAGTLNT